MDIDYSKLYYNKEVRVLNTAIAPFPIELSIELSDMRGYPDCRVGHFGYNFFFRTKYGMLYKKYKDAKHLEQAVAQALLKRGFQVLEWIDKSL